MALTFAGKAVGTAVIRYLTTKALHYLKDQLTAPYREKLRQSLTEKLPAIQAIFDAVDQRMVLEIESISLEEWLWQLRTAIEKADDAIDEFEFRSLEKARRQKLSTLLKLVEAPMSQKFGSSLQRLKLAIEGLDSVASGVGNFISIVTRMDNSSLHQHHREVSLSRETSRILTIDKVLGRSTESEQLIKWLTSSPSAHDDIAAIALVGIGGMGKTTLAQSICLDGKVMKQFGDHIVWIHVSSQFDPVVLTKKIIESLTRNKCAANTLDALQVLLEDLLLRNRFLLVLDDAWEDSHDHNKWPQFLAPLCKGCSGSRILITTRMDSVVCAVERMMKKQGKQFLKLAIGGLGSTHMLELFRSCAFGGSDIVGHQVLQLVSEQIVKKFIGSPLVATTVGQQLWNEQDRSKWTSILNQKFQYFAGPKVMDVLKLSYLNLPPELQMCFRYCSIFPPNYKFSMEEVVDMWISSGLISPRHEGGLSIEGTARQYFRVLIRKSLFSISAPTEDLYVMHELVYQLACFVSSKEVLRFEEAADFSALIPSTVRHVAIEGMNFEVIKHLSQSKDLCLRTLVINAGKDEQGFSVPKVEETLKELIKGSKGLRVLILHGNNGSVLKIPFRKLKHIRYISLSEVDESDLSEVFKLHHLEVIKIRNVKHQGEKRFSGIDNLLQLRRLDLPKETVSRIRHIGRLTTLQELNGFAVTVREEQGYQMTELRDLTRLQKLSVHDIDNVSNHVEASGAELDLKTEMSLLSLQWSGFVDCFHNNQVLEGLAPAKDLRQLIISGYTCRVPPRWLHVKCLPNLVLLKLEGCEGWVHLPILRMLPTLRHLYLCRLSNIFGIPSAQSRRGRAEDMGDVEDWIPPCLVTLVVKECPVISNISALPLTLRLLDICEAGVNRLPTMSVDQLTGGCTQLSELHVDSCQHLDSLYCFFQLSDYRALTRLSIIHCNTLHCLPAASIFQRMSKLETVVINDCKCLFSLGGLGALCGLRELTIKNCPCLVASLPQSRLMPGPSALLETLEIDDHYLLSVQPLRYFTNTKSLVISDGSGMAELPLNWLQRNKYVLESIEIRNATALESLPADMEFFLSLRRVCLTNALVLQLTGTMPPNLWSLSISGCHDDFKMKYGRGGPRWNQINHIPVVVIT